MSGWVKFHRKITEWQWYPDLPARVVFFHLILVANHKDKKWLNEVIKRGQKVTSYESLAQETGLSAQQVRTALDKLKSTNEVTIKSSNKYSIITVTNYEAYQRKDKADNNQITGEQQTDNNQITTNKNERKKEEEVVVVNTHEEIFVEVSKEIQTLMKGRILQTQIVHSWLNAGADKNLILDTLKVLLSQRGGDPPQTLKYFNNAIAEAIRTKNQVLKIGEGNATNSGNHTQNFGTSRRSKKDELDVEFQRALADNEARFAAMPGGG